MEYLTEFNKWGLFKSQKNADDLLQIVELEIEKNSGITIIANRFGRQFKSRIIVIPYAADNIIVKAVGSRAKIKKGEQSLDITKKDFNRLWRKCIEKKYKFILK